ncbi:uncharacterized protein LOC118454208 [Neolamprologus brichardi]|uniref:uncharacterized protein LOC118454208 n=1 Tax=Neolamprologus brichardi TaxID=32507 RepID=UPI001643B3A3|nr:uncharacterized protein LOC118454208 [Neolamprologus brichardi]
MMMTSAGITVLCGCVALLLTLTSVSAVRRTLNSINDLMSVGFGQSVPIHSLVLLHWFANTVNIDRNDVIHLTFNPKHDYGSHYYGNSGGLFELSLGSTYYTIGNINESTAAQLPPHVRAQSGHGNRVRVVIRVREAYGVRQVEHVYITQHYHQFNYRRSDYDPDQTYEVTTNLLREIREFSMDSHDMISLRYLRDRFGRRANDSQLECIRNMWGHLASLGLLFHIVGYTGPVQSYCNQAQLASRRNDSWSNIQDCPGFLCRLLLVVVLVFSVLCFLLLAAANKK